MLQLHLSDQQFNSHKGATCIRDLMVYIFLRFLVYSDEIFFRPEVVS